MKFLAVWLANKRLVSQAWYWHWTNKTGWAKNAVCIHKVSILSHCNACLHHEIPDNYIVKVERIAGPA